MFLGLRISDSTILSSATRFSLTLVYSRLLRSRKLNGVYSNVTLLTSLGLLPMYKRGNVSNSLLKISSCCSLQLYVLYHLPVVELRRSSPDGSTSSRELGTC